MFPFRKASSHQKCTQPNTNFAPPWLNNKISRRQIIHFYPLVHVNTRGPLYLVKSPFDRGRQEDRRVFFKRSFFDLLDSSSPSLQIQSGLFLMVRLVLELLITHRVCGLSKLFTFSCSMSLVILFYRSKVADWTWKYQVMYY